jgi:hypothetical protein
MNTDGASCGVDRTHNFRFRGRDFRLTDVHGELVAKLFA